MSIKDSKDNLVPPLSDGQKFKLPKQDKDVVPGMPSKGLPIGFTTPDLGEIAKNLLKQLADGSKAGELQPKTPENEGLGDEPNPGHAIPKGKIPNPSKGNTL